LREEIAEAPVETLLGIASLRKMKYFGKGGELFAFSAVEKISICRRRMYLAHHNTYPYK
jgi:hypothetical protein